MKNRLSLLAFQIGVSFLLTVPLACSEKPVRMDEPAMEPSADMHVQPLPNDQPTESVPQDILKTVYFDYDSSRLREDAKKLLRANAAWLNSHPSVKIQIEGHCDERGTKMYNLNLGEKRARVAKEFLETLGVSGDRMNTLSYGADPGETETDWNQNRKAVFLIVSE